MEIKNLSGQVIFVLKTAKTISELVSAAVQATDLRWAYLRGADLRGADLRGAHLSGADLSWADLRGAHLSGADLSGAHLSGAHLSGADLRGADLSGAHLSGADLSWAYLRGADLRGADLRRADLSWADLSGADLSGANIDGKTVAKFRVFTGLYAYEVWSVLFEDGSRWVRMGCLWKSLEDWDKIGIRESNLSEYPNDRSFKCEERASAFEFAKSVALRFEVPAA